MVTTDKKISVIKHESKTPWGFNAMFMTSTGESFGRVYWYSDEKEVATLDMLAVEKDHRRKGLGTIIQIERENYALENGFKRVCLWCDPRSWMKKWYEKRGYVYISDKDDEDGNIWMEKELK